MNEIQAGIRNKIPEKPDELVVYELIKSTGLHLVQGALIDQPHIWMMMWEVIDGTVELFRLTNELAEAQAK